MPEALDLRELDEAMDSLVFDGAEMQVMLEQAAKPMRDRWRNNIISEGLIGEEPFHYRDSLVIAEVSRRTTHATVEIAAAATTEPGQDIFYPAVLEYGSADITPTPVAMRAFDTTRRTVVRQIAEDTNRRVTSRRRRTKR